MQSTHLTEEQLLYAYAHEGINLHFLPLWQARWRELYDYLCRLIGDKRIAHLVTVRVFERKALQEYRENEPARAFLFRVAGNLGISTKRVMALRDACDDYLSVP